MVDDIIQTLRKRYGEEWGRDEEENLLFSADAEELLQQVPGAHLIGEPEISDDDVTLTVWVDFPLRDVLSADELAYEIFARFSEEIFYAERRFEQKGVRYRFVTGTPTHGHAGSLVLAGPHAADFAARQQARVNGGRGFQA